MTLGLALWILVAPLDLPNVWGWTIIDGPFETEEQCERVKENRLDLDRVLCTELARR